MALPLLILAGSAIASAGALAYDWAKSERKIPTSLSKQQIRISKIQIKQKLPCHGFCWRAVSFGFGGRGSEWKF